MARKWSLASDFSGEEIADGEEVACVVREHPQVTSPVQLDITKAEAEALIKAAAGDFVSVEVKFSTSVKQLLIPLDAFRKFAKDDVVKNARSTRGRQPQGPRY